MPEYAGKRALDLAIAVPLAVVLSPLIAAAAIAVKLSSPGPAIYAATRVGRGERRFRQYKLRSMVVGADSAGFRTATGDARITPLGRFLRMSSLDELPQLWNVVTGDMSLVGPRPAAVPQLADYTAAERSERASVRPGITGLAQVSGRSELATDRQIALDVDYARHASLGLDLRVIARTIGVVLKRPGAN